MENQRIIKGFSKLSEQEKRQLVSSFLSSPQLTVNHLESFLHPDPSVRHILSNISENTISAYPLPFNVAPNFLINDTMYMVPMVTEESSVVAAASSAARFWAERGGFKASVGSNTKNGQLHFLYKGDHARLKAAEAAMIPFLREYIQPLTQNMEKRGGGILQIELKDFSDTIDHYFQLFVTFNTSDAMGANFINSCLEEIAGAMEQYLAQTPGFAADEFEPLMAILSNYADQCIVHVSVSCGLSELEAIAPGVKADAFARRFALAVQIANEDVYRATTHNKGIMNGVDAVILATGNDFRAIEAGAHAYAAKSGKYRSLSRARVTDDAFRFSLSMPMALGTVGGLTRLHPLAATSLDILGHPDASQLMMVAAAAGLANNFAALRSLTTSGIQAGHMRMHLANILMQFQADDDEARLAREYFSKQKVSHQAVKAFLNRLRENKANS